MTTSRSRSGGMSGFAALIIGAFVAVIVGTLLFLLRNFMALGPSSPTVAKAVTAGIMLIVGLLVGGAAALARPSGPVVPLLAAVLAVIVNFVSNLVGVIIYVVIQIGGSPIEHARLFVMGYFEMDLVWLGILLLGPVAAAGLAAVRHLRSRKPQQGAVGWGGPPGGYPHPGTPAGGAPPYPGAPPPHQGAPPPYPSVQPPYPSSPPPHQGGPLPPGAPPPHQDGPLPPGAPPHHQGAPPPPGVSPRPGTGTPPPGAPPSS